MRSWMSSRENQNDLKPFYSLAIIITTLFTVAFLQMEERRMGYQIFYLSKEVKKIEQERRLKEIELAKVTKPSYLMQVAKSKLTLKRPDFDQIIHLAGPIKSYGSKKRLEIEN